MHSMPTINSTATATTARPASRRGRLLAALVGATCACSLPACDDPDSPEAQEVMQEDDALAPAEEAADLSIDQPEVDGFSVTGITAPVSYCGQTPTTCTTAPSKDWCATYKWLGDSVGVPALYVGIMYDKCKKNWNGACYECWDLQNYCQQANSTGTVAVCKGLWAKCACLAVQLGEPQTY